MNKIMPPDNNLTKMKKSLNLVAKILEWLIFAIILFIFVVVLSPLLPTKDKGALYVVASGSMEPTIQTGSVALVQSTDTTTLQSGEIIAFVEPTDSTKTVIHRIYQVQNDGANLFFITKGDNNQSPDAWQVPASLVKGKYTSSIPYLGYPAEMLKTRLGFILIVGIPALILVILQIIKIKQGIEEEVQKRVHKKLGEVQNG
ncbi:signal peptidase I [Patescibacteria group bacterium]|nr:signal peptidase I [Patescibacteria group bacterium]